MPSMATRECSWRWHGSLRAYQNADAYHWQVTPQSYYRYPLIRLQAGQHSKSAQIVLVRLDFGVRVQNLKKLCKKQ